MTAANSFLTQAQAREAIYQQWKTGWEAIHSQISTDPTYVPYTFENSPGFVEPPNPQQRWARVSVRHGNRGQHTLATPGQRVYMAEAMIWVQLFGPVDAGLGGLDDLCDDARTFLEGNSFGGITPGAAAPPREVGDEGRWYEVVLTIPVTYYALR